MIEVKSANKSFGDNHVLKNLSATLYHGDVNLIIGRSGQGKSVLAKCIVGLLDLDSGDILYQGENFSKMNRNERKEIRKEIGMLFQGSALFDFMNVEENVMFPLKMFTKMSKKEMLDRANFCLERVNLVGTNHLTPAELSGGMKKRVGIARAISMKPKYLFCDEPNSGLDPETSILIDNLIHDITKEYQMTTVVITHDMNSVIEIGEHINFIHNGENWWQGNKTEIIKTDNPEILSFVYASEFMKNLKGKLSEI